MVDAIILAGGQKKSLYSAEEKLIDEAFLNIAGRYMVEYVVEALRGSSYINKIIIAGPMDGLKQVYGLDKDIFLVDKGNTTIRSFCNALKQVEDSVEYVLALTADVPLITSIVIDDFIEECIKRDADLFYPIVSKDRNEKKYPGIRRTYVNLKDGVFTGGNALFVRPKLINEYVKDLEALVHLRKKPLSLASYFGWGLVLKLLMGKLSISDVEKRIEKLFNIKCVGIISRHPEIGIDVDKHSDFNYIQKVMSW